LKRFALMCLIFFHFTKELFDKLPTILQMHSNTLSKVVPSRTYFV
jgi:hypothetical protein